MSGVRIVPMTFGWHQESSMVSDPPVFLRFLPTYDTAYSCNACITCCSPREGPSQLVSQLEVNHGKVVGMTQAGSMISNLLIEIVNHVAVFYGYALLIVMFFPLLEH